MANNTSASSLAIGRDVAYLLLSLICWACCLFVDCSFAQAQEHLANYAWTKTVGGLNGAWLSGGPSSENVHPYAIQSNLLAKDDNGRLYIGGKFAGNDVDFDASIGTDPHSSNGAYDTYLTSYDGSGNFLWARTFGGIGAETATAIYFDRTNNFVYILGNFQSTVDFDPGPQINEKVCPTDQNEERCMFVSKFDFSGNYISTFALVAEENSHVSSVGLTTDQIGNIYLLGTFYGSLDFDPSVGEDLKATAGPGSFNMYVAKYSPIGGYLFCRTIGTFYGNLGSITTDGTSKLFVAGTFHSLLDFDPGAGTDSHLGSNYQDTFITLYDLTGSYQWTKVIVNLHSVVSLTIDGSGNLYTAGLFSNTIDFNPEVGTDSLSSVGNDIFLSKYDSSGTYQWTSHAVRCFEISGYRLPAPVLSVDPTGMIYVTGEFDSPCDFDPGTGADTRAGTTDSDVFLSSFDGSGNRQWTKTFGGTGLNGDTGLLLNIESITNNINLVGYFNSRVDLDPGPGIDLRNSDGYFDLYQSTYSPTGEYLGASTIAGPAAVISKKVVIDYGGSIYVGGDYFGTVDFDPSDAIDLRTWTASTSSNNYNGFITKYAPTGAYISTITLNVINGYYSVDTLSIDQSNNLFVGGYFGGTVDFDPGPRNDIRTSTGSSDFYLSKYNSSGNCLWTKVIRVPGYYRDFYANKMSNRDDDTLQIVGHYSGTLDFDPGAGLDEKTSAESWELFITKYSSAGEYLGTSVFQDSIGYHADSAAFDHSGNLYVSGSFSGTHDFNPGASLDNRTSTGEDDVFFSKFSPTGTYLWTRTFGSATDDYGPEVTTDLDGNIYLMGSYYDTTDFDPGASTDLKTADEGVSFWSKYDSSGNYYWTKVYGHENNYPTGVAYSDQQNNLYFVGTFYGSVDFDPSSGLDIRDSGDENDYNFYYHTFISKFDSSGTYGWTATGIYSGARPGDNQLPYGLSFASQANGTVVYTGGLDTTVEFGNQASLDIKNHKSKPAAADVRSPQSSLDMFLTKFSPDITTDKPVILSPISGLTTPNRRPTISGTAEPGSTVSVYGNGNIIGTTTTDSQGNWTLLSSSDWDFGLYILIARSKDQSANVSQDSNSVSLTIFDLANSDLDHDGVSYAEESRLGLNANNPDTDDDGVLDGQELIDKTDPLDRGSKLLVRDIKLCAEWNGFFSMVNILEHLNMSDHRIAVSSHLDQMFGEGGGTLAFGLKGGLQYDELVNSLPGFEPELYGKVCSTLTEGSAGDLDGQMMHYKPDGGSGYEYVIAIPLSGGTTGEQFLSFNTYQPSQNPQDAENLVANWIQIVNLDENEQKGTLIFYDASGSEIQSRRIKVAGSGRGDYAAHELGRDKTGLVRWIPRDHSARFIIKNLRYYYDNPNVSNHFQGAFALSSAVGSGDLLSVPFDTINNLSVLEVSNTSAESIKVPIRFYSEEGAPQGGMTLKLEARASNHVIVNTTMNNTRGIATIQGSSRESIIGHVMQYHLSSDNRMLTVYGIQAQAALGSTIRGTYNTYLGQGCELLLVNPTTLPTTVSLNLKQFDATTIVDNENVSIPATSLTVYPLCEKAQNKNVYGVVTVRPESPNTVTGNVVRTGLNQQYRLAIPLR